MPLHVNYEFILDQCQTLARNGTILDYGCGAGEVVEEGQQRGLNIVGVDSFSMGGFAGEQKAAERGLLECSVFSLDGNFRIPFPRRKFDLVVANQVFEHVNDLDLTLNEISRVLKPNSQLLTLFPAKDVIREGHCGIPFAHRFQEDSRLRYFYMRILRGLGLGYFKNGKTQRQWVMDFIEYLNNYTFYRSNSEIHASFLKAGFAVKHIEDRYINYRLIAKGMRPPKHLTGGFLWNFLSGLVCRKLGGMVILAERGPIDVGTNE